MTEFVSLTAYLEQWRGDDESRYAVTEVVAALAEASVRVGELIAEGAMAGALDRAVGENVDGDVHKALDVQANDWFVDVLRDTPVAALGSEELDDVLSLGEGSLAVTLDPLDGSSNIATNVSVGSIFSIYPAAPGESPRASVLQCGDRQLGAGFIVYGPQTTLALSLRDGTHVFTLSRRKGEYFRTTKDLVIPAAKAEYAINGSNARHWDPTVSEFIAEYQAGKDGPLGRNYNTRWVASLVAEAFRIFARGGVFLYPSDKREGYADGRLRLVYEANAVALLVEQAGGRATDGRRRILELVPSEVHQRTPLVFGSADEVERLRAKYGPL